MSLLNKAVIEAVRRGYSISETGSIINPYGETIAGYPNSSGYYTFGIKLPNSRKQLKVMAHKLQAYQKFGEALFQPKICVRHLNGVSTDNSKDNIAIGSYSDNMMDQPKGVRVRKASLANMLYDHAAVKDFYISSGRSYKKTMLKFGISSKGTLHFILNDSLKSSE